MLVEHLKAPIKILFFEEHKSWRDKIHAILAWKVIPQHQQPLWDFCVYLFSPTLSGIPLVGEIISYIY